MQDKAAKIEEKAKATVEAVTALYREIHAEELRYPTVVIDVTADDVKERYAAMANRLRSFVVELRTSGLPLAMKLQKGAFGTHRELTDDEITAENAARAELLAKDLEQRAEELAWRAARVPAGAVFRLGGSEADHLWDQAPSLAAALRKIVAYHQ